MNSSACFQRQHPSSCVGNRHNEQEPAPALKILRAEEKRFNLFSTQLVYKAFNKSLRDSISKEIKHCFLSMASMHTRCLKCFQDSGHSLFLPYSLFHVTRLSPQAGKRTTELTPLMPGHCSSVICAHFFTFSLTESVSGVWVKTRSSQYLRKKINKYIHIYIYMFMFLINRAVQTTLNMLDVEQPPCCRAVASSWCIHCVCTHDFFSCRSPSSSAPRASHSMIIKQQYEISILEDTWNTVRHGPMMKSLLG